MPADPRPQRSLLFLPASKPSMIVKARTLPCDIVVLDLEDAVAPEDKAAARANVVAAAAEGGFGDRQVLVRINALDTEWANDDFGALLRAYEGLDGIVVPKVNDGKEAGRVATRLFPAPDKIKVWAMIETCRSLFQLPNIAATQRMAGLILGFNDLAAEMNAQPGADRAPFHPVMTFAVAAGRANGLAVIDGVFNGIDDELGFEREARQARQFGMDGKSLIHPKQIEPCNRAFHPSDEEIAWARAVVGAYEAAAGGAIRVQGRMVEAMHVAQAKRVLALL